MLERLEGEPTLLDEVDVVSYMASARTANILKEMDHLGSEDYQGLQHRLSLHEAWEEGYLQSYEA